jgi:dynein heavy chain
MEVYATIRTSLLPTPAKSHYLYNMRDLSKVFQVRVCVCVCRGYERWFAAAGVRRHTGRHATCHQHTRRLDALRLQGMQSLGTPLQDSRSLVRLWAHEAMRVFHDRLVDDADRGWFCGLLARMPPKHFGVAFSEAFPLSAAEEAEAVASVAAAAGGDATAAGSAAGAAAQQAVAAAALRNVVFVAFVQPGVPEAARYQEAGDTGALLKRVEDALVEHNEQASDTVLCRCGSWHCLAWQRALTLSLSTARCHGANTPKHTHTQVKSHLDLVVFKYAAEHLARISRIIKQPYGNALLVGRLDRACLPAPPPADTHAACHAVLVHPFACTHTHTHIQVGVGGSGRQSLTRLAAFMADYKLFSIEITKSYGLPEWREDLKKVLLQAGCAGAPTVFLFSDSQLKHESFLEDINNILNTGAACVAQGTSVHSAGKDGAQRLVCMACAPYASLDQAASANKPTLPTTNQARCRTSLPRTSWWALQRP